MKRCLTCQETYLSSTFMCHSCNNQIPIIDGFHAYAPELAIENEGFKSTFFAELAALEENNFWFIARNKLILWALKKYCPLMQSFLEIGCGTGYVLKGIASKFQHAAIYGSEIFTSGLHFATSRVPAASLMQMDARNIPYQNEFDAIGAFDVLEHIKEDEQVLLQMHAALKPNGFIILTVPQHQWLWSSVDEHACHVIRYSAKDLHKKISTAGFEIVRSTSFVSLLLPAMMLSRLQKKNPDENASSELALSSTLNKIFLQFLQIEIACIKLGINFPLGGSRLIIAKKK